MKEEKKGRVVEIGCCEEECGIDGAEGKVGEKKMRQNGV